MALDLSPAFEQLVAQQLTRGASAEALLTEALMLLDARRAEAVADRQFRDALAQGAESMKTGAFFDAEEVFDQLDDGLDDGEVAQWPHPSYLLSDLARRDLTDLKSFLLSSAGRRVARFVLRGLEESMRFLATDPTSGETSRERYDSFGEWPAFSYVIVYEPRSNPLRIARVLRHPCADRFTSPKAESQRSV